VPELYHVHDPVVAFNRPLGPIFVLDLDHPTVAKHVCRGKFGRNGQVVRVAEHGLSPGRIHEPERAHTRKSAHTRLHLPSLTPRFSRQVLRGDHQLQLEDLARRRVFELDHVLHRDQTADGELDSVPGREFISDFELLVEDDHNHVQASRFAYEHLHDQAFYRELPLILVLEHHAGLDLTAATSKRIVNVAEPAERARLRELLSYATPVLGVVLHVDGNHDAAR